MGSNVARSLGTGERAKLPLVFSDEYSLSGPADSYAGRRPGNVVQVRQTLRRGRYNCYVVWKCESFNPGEISVWSSSCDVRDGDGSGIIDRDHLPTENVERLSCREAL